MTLLTLNVFSNVAAADPGRNFSHHAVRSFLAAFPDAAGAVAIRLFTDPNPNPARDDAWTGHALDRLEGLDVETVPTEGLAHGFRLSVETAQTPYCLQLEHDFVFLPAAIHHDLETLCAGMAALGESYLKFNKRWNRPQGYDYFMEEVAGAPFPCCRVNGRSNNPHILETAFYRARVLPHIEPERSRGSGGVEGKICAFVGGGLVYGGLGHPAAVGHLDGRMRRFRDALFRRRWLARAQ